MERLLTFGVLYWIIPKIFNTPLYSKKLATTHFWIGTIGIVLYAIPMYWAGFTQAMMWKQFTEEGTLKYQFLETVTQIIPIVCNKKHWGPFILIRHFADGIQYY